MGYTLGEAAKATGISKASLSRAVGSGRISAVKNEDGSFSIEPVELHRVYPPKSSATVAPQGDGTPRNTSDNPNDASLLQVRLEAALEQLRDRDATIDDLRRRLDVADEERREAQGRLMGLLTGPPRKGWRGLFTRDG